LEPPLFTVGKSDAILQVLPTALRFWEKLGLGPRGGKKDVTAFALFEDDGEDRQGQVERWLGDMSATYTVSTFDP
jgi:mediator of RNA polymerase II transcription subunit 13, fungi type